MVGHRVGSDKLRDVCKDCIHFGIEYLTVYAFSTENWKRPQKEVDSLMKLVTEFFVKFEDEMAEEGIRVRFAGEIDRLPQATRETVKRAVETSADRDRLQLVVALNYGSREEIWQACQKLAADLNARPELSANGDASLLRNYLYLPEIPDPDLIIRPGGEKRLSNYLLWQAAYSEFWFTDTLWPDFDRDDLRAALEAFNARDRRYGGVKG